MADISGLIGSSAPSQYGIDPALLAQIQGGANYWNGVTDASANAPPQAAPPQAAAPQGMIGSQAPQVKPGLLDYIMAGVFDHRTPMEVNAAANMANLSTAANLARMRGLNASTQGLMGLALQGAGGGVPQAPAQGSTGLPNILTPQASPAQAPAPSPALGGAGSAPNFPSQSLSPVSSPSPAQRALPYLLLNAQVNGSDPATVLAAMKYATPNLESVNGTMVDKDDPNNANRVIAPAAADGLQYGVGQGGQITAAAIPGYQAGMAANAYSKEYATDVAKPPIPGAIMGPNGWIMPGQTRATIAGSDADKATIQSNAEQGAIASHAYAKRLGENQADVATAGGKNYGDKLGDANADRLVQARTDLKDANEKRAAFKALLDASDRAGSGTFNLAAGGLDRAFQTITGQSMPKISAQATFQALAPSLYQAPAGLQIRNEREFELAKARVPTLAQDPVARRRIIQYAALVNEQKAREAQIVQNFAAKAQGGLNGTLGTLNGRPATVDDYINQARARNPLSF